MDTLAQIYMFCAGAGFIYIVGTAALGSLAGEGDAATADGGGDGGDGGDFATVDAGGEIQAAGKANLAHLKTGTTQERRLNLGLLMLKLTSPSTIAMFAFGFGLSGLIVQKYFSLIGAWSVVPATISGVMAYKVMCLATNAIADKLYASSNYKTEQMIGHGAEVSVPISDGRMGEIIYLNGRVRSTAPAKAANSETLKAACKVVITDVRDGVFFVEQSTDD